MIVKLTTNNTCLSVTMCFQFFKLLILFSLLMLVKGDNDCGIAAKPESNRIVGGRSIGYVKYQWYAALVQARDSKSLACGGTLISKKFVLTAAHCFKPFFKQAQEGLKELRDIYIVKLGVDNICIQDEKVQIIATKEVFIQENYYKDMLYYDIALVLLESEVDNFMPACLPPARYESNNRTGLDGTVVGLGKESSTAWRLPCEVKETEVEIQTDATCRSFLAEHKESGERMHDAFCAGDGLGERDTCQGDSGGPLQVTMSDDRIMVLGITSFGFGCAAKQTYGMYTDVSHYLDWIHEKMAPFEKSVANSETTPKTHRQLATENPPAPPENPPRRPKHSRNILQQILNW